jgi:hypothetical protein
MKHILANRIRTPDGTILQSFHSRDYKSHVDAIDGHKYYIDGGITWPRYGYVTDCMFEDLSVWSDDPHELIREAFHWGTYGKYGNEPLRYIPLKDMEETHIRAVLDTQNLKDYIEVVFRNELKYRWSTERKNNEL